MAVKDIVEKAIEENTVVVFSKTTCPYCRQVKALFKKGFPDVEVKVIEIDEVEDGRLIQDYLQQKSGQRTVPNIFIKQKHIGGCDDTISLNQSGKLKAILA
ncbi:glutaredoxin [Pterulicium gracile]|uniref:Glutaredoxin n=1 Tax=Pterulicium gracile TaxID=1884261 RepID=A0A5C3QZ43_9AGAR|nr:glutaredoxin [Pterula gracilis]